VSIIENGQPLFTITRKELNTVTVWNPWVENAKKMSDFGDEEYKGMVCVEPGAVKSWSVLEGGDAWEGTQTIRPRL
jgi:glucose-6-phosphate 1-epimerase